MFSSIKAIPSSSLQKVIVSFELTDPSMDLTGYAFELERAETKEGPWYSVSVDMTSLFMEDDTVDTILKGGNLFHYRITATDALGEETLSPIAMLSMGESDRYALAVAHNYYRWLKSQEYKDFFLYRRSKTSGLCPTCFDDVRMEPSDPNCPVCGGTGNIDGYIGPIKIMSVILNPVHNETLIKELFGETTVDVSAARAWTTGDHLISPEDVIVDGFSNQAYEVSQNAKSMRRDFLIRQAVSMRKLKQGHPIYNVIGGA